MKSPEKLLWLASLTAILGCDSSAPSKYALTFSGTDRQEVHVGVVTSKTNRYTVEAWFRLDPSVDIESGIEPGIVGQHAGTDDANGTLDFSEGKLRFLMNVFQEDGSSIHHKVFYADPVEQGVWTHAAGTYDGQYLILYVNGREVRRVEDIGRISIRASRRGTHIGGYSGTSSAVRAWFT